MMVRSALRIALGIAVVLTVLFAVWWFIYRRIPTLKVTYTVGRGGQVDLDWIDLRQNPELKWW